MWARPRLVVRQSSMRASDDLKLCAPDLLYQSDPLSAQHPLSLSDVDSLGSPGDSRART